MSIIFYNDFEYNYVYNFSPQVFKFCLFSQNHLQQYHIWLTKKICLVESKVFDNKLLNSCVTTTVPLSSFNSVLSYPKIHRKIDSENFLSSSHSHNLISVILVQIPVEHR